ncbi:hypothetical protein jhhlp_006208 [Lomentospora prolificans]|uniref:DUF1365 domain-containing protein n=1 Tax=Lomentospora prolificans TaxID=41688 RepID=A0A2N3N5F1_9PEZI|nr:hypothetical protein jhhlp_006208 [Lomentospora prolificans]
MEGVFVESIEYCWPVLVAGQALFGSQLDWFFLAASILWRHKYVATLAYSLISPFLPAFIIGFLFVLYQPLRFLALLFDHTEPGPTDCGRPVFFKCQTTHRRVFPERHAFVYSYLVTGIPVSWKGQTGGMLSVETPRAPNMLGSLAPRGVRQVTWFEVNPEDHFQRGCANMGLREKLDVYLRSEGVEPTKYPYVYLITAPRILGYSFNPVSFWYMYNESKDLSAVICEVNNTFDERRVYLVYRNDTVPATRQLPNTSKGPVGPYGTHGRANGEPSTATFKIRNKWAKDFHVSPFNSRKGHYSIVASDPLGPNLDGFRRLDTTITLSSSKGHAKLVARLASLGEPLDPAKMSVLEKLGLLAGWGWIGLVTYPRIVREAAKLWFSRKLHVWYRPEPLGTNIGRRADVAEMELEGIFRQYLRCLVRRSPADIVVRYVPGGVDAPMETIRSPTAEETATGTNELELKVLTPAFYTRFVHYAHDFEAIFSEFRESCTISISNPDLLPRLVLKKSSPPVQVGSPIDYIYFKMIQNLRQRPSRIERPLRSSDGPKYKMTDQRVVDIRDFRLSSMDGYILSEATGETRKVYRAIVMRLFLAQHIALGSLGVLWLEGLILRGWFAWVLAAGMDSFVTIMASKIGMLLSAL